MSKVKIFVADPVSASGLELFKDNGGFEIVQQAKLTGDALNQAVSDADAVIVRSETQISQAVLSAGKKIRIVGRAGVGVDNIDVAAASRQGIVVVNVPGGNTISAAEHTVAMMLALSRNIPQANQSLKKGEWKRNQFVGTELLGKTLGLIGLGRIGKEVAKRAQSFGMRVIGFDPYASEEYAHQLNIGLMPLESLYKEADYISVHVPLSDATKHLLNEKTLMQLKPGVRLINCARGGIIDELALCKAIESGHVKGAAIDVFEQEPAPVDHPFFKVPQIIVTPHLGASTEEAQVKVAHELCETIRDYFLTGQIRNAVNLPSMGAEEYKELEPYMDLSEKLGRFSSQMLEGVSSLKITYAGEIGQKNTVPVTLSILKGFLSPILDISVNLVNAPHLAKERGLKWTETKQSASADYTSLITIEAKSAKTTFSVSGTLFGNKTPRLVQVDGMSVDVEPNGTMIVFSNQDKPGVIGFIGTLLGQNQVNIAAMKVGRKSLNGEAVTIVNVDSDVSNTILDQIRKHPGITNVHLVQF